MAQALMAASRLKRRSSASSRSAEEAIDLLSRIMRESGSDQARIAAAKALLDRIEGKLKASATSGERQKTLKIEVRFVEPEQQIAEDECGEGGVSGQAATAV